MWWFTLNQGNFEIWSFVHSLFLAIMGFINPLILIEYIEESDKTEGAEEMTIDQGRRVLMFGLILGVTCYLAGEALSLRADTVLKMIGMNGLGLTDTTFKKYDEMYNIDKDQPVLLWLLGLTQQFLPVAYLLFIEIGVICSTYLTFAHLIDPIDNEASDSNPESEEAKGSTKEAAKDSKEDAKDSKEDVKEKVE